MIRTLAFVMLTALPAAAENITTFTLENGMQAVVIENHRAPVVEHMVWYRIGAADEPAGKSGIAHFLEHLMFKGTDDRDAGEFSHLVEANGGSDNAFTSYDYTAYYQRVAADRLDLMMELEADRMRDLEMTESDVATERDVILEERNQRTDSDPGALFMEQRQAAQYMNHPYGIPIIGWRREMEQLSRDDAFSFYNRFYAPNNAILIVAGDVDPEEVKSLAEKHYGPVPPSDSIVPRDRPQEPPQLSERRMTFSDPRVSQPYLVRSYLAPERDPGAQEKGAALTYLAEIFAGSGATSVLGQKLQFDTQTAVYTGAYYDGSSLDDGTFSLIVVPAEDVSLADAEAAMDTVLEEFLASGIDDAQFERVKFQIRAAQIYAQDDISGLARRYGEGMAIGLTVEDIEAWPSILDAVTKEDVMEAAREVFDRRRAVTGYLMSEAAE